MTKDQPHTLCLGDRCISEHVSGGEVYAGCYPCDWCSRVWNRSSLKVPRGTLLVLCPECLAKYLKRGNGDD